MLSLRNKEQKPSTCRRAGSSKSSARSSAPLCGAPTDSKTEASVEVPVFEFGPCKQVFSSVIVAN